jgi:hypothetical protein
LQVRDLSKELRHPKRPSVLHSVVFTVSPISQDGEPA